MIKFLVDNCKKAILLPTLKLGYKNTHVIISRPAISPDIISHKVQCLEFDFALVKIPIGKF